MSLTVYEIQRGASAELAPPTPAAADREALPDMVLQAQAGSGARIVSYATANDQYWGTPGTSVALDPGFYMPGSDQRGYALHKMKTATDDLLELPDPVNEILMTEFVNFWQSAPKMIARKLSLKRGLFLYGPPGSRKTSNVHLMAKHMIDQMGGVVFMANEPGCLAGCMQLFRRVEPARPLICVFEDMDALVDRYGEAQWLAILDGELQVSGVVNVATCNYPERLDPRFTNRPGRFDRIVHVDMPGAETRSAYFTIKAPELNDDPKKLARWIEASEGWSMAHLREMIVGHYVLGEDDESVIERMNHMRDQLPKSDDHREGVIGFGAKRAMAARELRNYPR